MDPEAKIINFTAISPSEITSALLYDANEALGQLKKLREYGYFIPGVEQMEQDIKSAIDKGCFAWLRRALTSYIVRKCRDLLETRENNA